MYALSFSLAAQGWFFLTRFLFLMELMVDHVYRRIQFELMILVVCASFVVWVVVSPTYSDCDPVRVFSFDDVQFTT